MYKKILIEYRKSTWFQHGTIIRSYYSFTVSDVNESAVMSDARRNMLEEFIEFRRFFQ